MVSEDVLNPKFSKFSLAILKDSGWYEIHMEKAEKISWGHNEGCNFVTGQKNIIEHSEHCELSGSLRCSDDFTYISKCNKSKYTNSFHINQDHQSCNSDSQIHKKTHIFYFEQLNYESQCQLIVQNNTMTSGCVVTQCPEGTATSYTIITTQDSKEVKYTCTSKDQEITINETTKFVCSDPATVCKSKFQCKKNCYHRGRCLEDGTCLCNNFYSGDTCQYFNDCSNNVVVTKKKSSFFATNSRLLESKESLISKEVCTWVKTFNKIDSTKFK